MTTTNPEFCGICSEAFNEEERCPRNLPCSHHLCTECIGQLIDKDTKKCPFCRTDFDAESTEELVMNNTVLESIKHIPTVRAKSHKRNVKMSSAYQKRINDFKEEVCKHNTAVTLELSDLKNDIERLLKGEDDLQKSLHTLNQYLSEDVTTRIQKLVAKIGEDLEISNSASLKLRDSLKKMRNNEEKLLSARGVLDSASTLHDASIIIDETEEVNMLVKEWAEDLQDYVSKQDIQLQERRKELKVSEKFQSSLMKFLTTKPEEESSQLIPITRVSANRMDLSRQMTAIGLWEMRSPVKLVVEQGRVFALQMLNGKRRSARVSIENGKLLLYSLQEEKEPIENAYYIPYEDFVSVANPPSSVFLDLKTKEVPAGRVYICLSDSGKANNIHLHFTGISGKCYSSKPLQIANRGQLWERALFGYEESEATNSNQGTYSLAANYFVTGNSGTVSFLGGSKTPPLIAIHTGPFNQTSCQAIGNVIEGLDIISDVIYWSENIQDIIVSHCGLVLPTRNPLEN